MLSSNPARGAARMRIDLPSAGNVTAEVLDLQGRRVRALESGQGHASGSFDLAWDGRNEAGGAVAPGLYFVRVRTASDAAALRLVEIE
jgi:flagellar basal-body rod modification protein FlgD